ncbi:hypothetical protein ACB092_08G118500 [Castanea dentata]
MKRVSAFSLSAPCYYYVSWCNHGLLSCGTCHSLMFESDWLICNLRIIRFHLWEVERMLLESKPLSMNCVAAKKIYMQ